MERRNSYNEVEDISVYEDMSGDDIGKSRLSDDENNLSVYGDDVSRSNSLVLKITDEDNKAAYLVDKYNRLLYTAKEILNEKIEAIEEVSSVQEIPRDIKKLQLTIEAKINDKNPEANIDIFDEEDFLELSKIFEEHDKVKDENSSESYNLDTNEINASQRMDSSKKNTALIQRKEVNEIAFEYCMFYDRIIFILDRGENVMNYSFLVLAGKNLPDPNRIKVSLVHDACTNYVNDDFEELAGEFYYVKLPKDFDTDALYVGIPHALSKTTGSKIKDRVMSIRASSVDNQTWATYLGSQEVNIQLPDVDINRICMARIEYSEFMVTVVSRPYVQKLEFCQNETFCHQSPIDSRIRIQTADNTFPCTTWLNLQILQIDNVMMNEMKERYGSDFNDLNACSPLLNMSWATEIPESKLQNAIRLSIPLIANTGLNKRRLSRIASSVSHISNISQNHVKTKELYITKEELLSETTHILAFKNDSWISVDKTVTLEINKIDKHDLVQVQFKEFYQRLIVLKTKAKVTPSQAEKMAKFIVSFFNKKPVIFIIRAKKNNPYDLIVSVINKKSLDKVSEILEEEDYTIVHGDTNQQQIINEGCRIRLKLHGNIKNIIENEILAWTHSSLFNSFIQFNIQVSHIFMQRAYSQYRGYLSFEALNQKKRAKNVHKKTRRHDAGNEAEFIHQVILNFPKDPSLFMQKPAKRLHLKINDENEKLKNQCFMQIAKNIGEDFAKLCQKLDMAQVEISPNSSSKEIVDSKYEMLKSWYWNHLKFSNKKQKLMEALSLIGREDLGQELERSIKTLNKENIEKISKYSGSTSHSRNNTSMGLSIIEYAEYPVENFVKPITYRRKYYRKAQQNTHQNFAKKYSYDDAEVSEIAYEKMPEEIQSKLQIYSEKIVEKVIMKNLIDINEILKSWTKKKEKQKTTKY